MDAVNKAQYASLVRTHVSSLARGEKWRVSTVLVIATFLLAGCGTAVPRGPSGPAVTAFKPDTPLSVELRREQLVGWWYGDQPTKEGGRVQWIMRRAADGTFTVTFRTTDVAGKTREQTEIGEWGVNANFIVTITKGWVRNGLVDEAPGGESFFWDVYEVLNAKPESLSYRSVESRNEYRVTKVANGFEFPKLAGRYCCQSFRP